MIRRWNFGLQILLLLVCRSPLLCRDKGAQRQPLAEYLAHLPQASGATAAAPAPGSLWIDAGLMGALAADYKARAVGDPVVIEIVEQTTAQSTGKVDTQRSFATSSGISGLAGRVHTAGIQDLFTANSNSKLQGQGQSASSSQLRTRIAGVIAAVLPNGSLVVESQREVTMNNERQLVVLRGVARPGDLSPDNVVRSTSLAALQLEVKGKGVISDATRPPNWIIRTLLRVVGF